jgi:hypothetical protein
MTVPARIDETMEISAKTWWGIVLHLSGSTQTTARTAIKNTMPKVGERHGNGICSVKKQRKPNGARDQPVLNTRPNIDAKQTLIRQLKLSNCTTIVN